MVKYDNIDISKFGEICSVNRRWSFVQKKYPNFTKRQLQKYAMKHGIYLKSSKWTDDELDYLKINYVKYNNDYLCDNMDRTKQSISRMAQKLNLRKPNEVHYASIQIDNLEKLKFDNHITYYYIGFLMADGSFSKKCLSIDISNKDKNHLISLSRYLDIEDSISIHNYRSNASLRISDSKNLPYIMDKFDIRIRKTYNPPIKNYYESFNKYLYYSLIIGFIDGDGHIREHGGTIQITIELHYSWVNFLNTLLHAINVDVKLVKSKVRKTKRGYAILTLCGVDIYNHFMCIIDKYNLPVLYRKWSL